MRAAMGQMAGILSNPMKAFHTQMQFWQNTTALYAELTQATISGHQQLPSDGDTDARFADEEWNKHPLFYYLKRQYKIMSVRWRWAS